MRIRFSILLLFSLLFSISACAQSKSGPTGKLAPSIKFDEEQFDFGEVQTGILVKHTFKFRNAGTDTLRINRIDPG